MEPIDLNSRKEVWIALSELFLDTDVTLSYDYIIRVCAASEYSLQELRDILKNEVSPVCSINLLSVAGEWSGFDKEWLVSNIFKRTYNKRSWLGELLKPFNNYGFKIHLKDHWEKLEYEIEKKRKNA